MIYPIRAGSREELLALERVLVDPNQAGALLSSLPITFWFFALLSVALTIWRLTRWTLAVRVIYAVATWRALVVVLLAEALTAYAQLAVLNPLYRQATDQVVDAA